MILPGLRDTPNSIGVNKKLNFCRYFIAVQDAILHGLSRNQERDMWVQPHCLLDHSFLVMQLVEMGLLHLPFFGGDILNLLLSFLHHMWVPG